MKTYAKVTAVVGPVALCMAAAACGGGSGVGGNESASDYPSRPVTFIIPYSAGGGSDQQFRRLQPHLEEQLGTRFNPTYVTGGDGAAGWQKLHDAQPDGYTLSNVVMPNIGFLAESGSLGFKATDLTYTAWTEQTPDSLTVAKDSEFTDLEGFIAAAKQDPGGLTVAGTGLQGRLGVNAIEDAAGIDVTFVPISGGFGDLLPRLMGGHVDAAYFGASHVLEHTDSLRALGLSGKEGMSVLPDVPTFASLGYKGIVMQNAWGIAAPPGTPDEIVEKLNEAINAAVEEEQKTLEELGLTPLKQSPAEVEEYTQTRVSDLKDLIDSGS